MICEQTLTEYLNNVLPKGSRFKIDFDPLKDGSPRADINGVVIRLLHVTMRRGWDNSAKAPGEFNYCLNLNCELRHLIRALKSWLCYDPDFALKEADGTELTPLQAASVPFVETPEQIEARVRAQVLAEIAAIPVEITDPVPLELTEYQKQAIAEEWLNNPSTPDEIVDEGVRDDDDATMDAATASLIAAVDELEAEEARDDEQTEDATLEETATSSEEYQAATG